MESRTGNLEEYREIQLCGVGVRKTNEKLEPSKEKLKITERGCTCRLIRERRSKKAYAL